MACPTSCPTQAVEVVFIFISYFSEGSKSDYEFANGQPLGYANELWNDGSQPIKTRAYGCNRLFSKMKYEILISFTSCSATSISRTTNRVT